MSNTDELLGIVTQLKMLLEQPHHGVIAWQNEYRAQVERFLAFFAPRPRKDVTDAIEELSRWRGVRAQLNTRKTQDKKLDNSALDLAIRLLTEYSNMLQ